jgi:hypothetical protein
MQFGSLTARNLPQAVRIHRANFAGLNPYSFLRILLEYSHFQSAKNPMSSAARRRDTATNSSGADSKAGTGETVAATVYSSYCSRTRWSIPRASRISIGASISS